MTEQTAVAEVLDADFEPVADATSTTALVMDRESMENMMALAETMARAIATVPKHFQQNPSDCLAVVMQAMQWRMNPFAVAQKTHLVNGTLGYEAQLVIAVINSRAPIVGRMKFGWGGDWSKWKDKNCKDPTLTATASAVLKGESEPTALTISMARVGVRNSPNWESDPQQQLAYLAAKKWARLHCPDVILGVYTPDELDGAPAIRDVGPKTATQYGEAARAKGDTIDVKLIEDTEQLAREKGNAGISARWKEMTLAERKSIPRDDWTRIRVLADEFDAKAKQGAEQAGPSCAQLMESIKAAADIDALNQVLSDAAALPADQQAEVKAAVDARSKEIGQ